MQRLECQCPAVAVDFMGFFFFFNQLWSSISGYNPNSSLVWTILPGVKIRRTVLLLAALSLLYSQTVILWQESEQLSSTVQQRRLFTDAAFSLTPDFQLSASLWQFVIPVLVHLMPWWTGMRCFVHLRMEGTCVPGSPQLCFDWCGQTRHDRSSQIEMSAITLIPRNQL